MKSEELHKWARTAVLVFAIMAASMVVGKSIGTESYAVKFERMRTQVEHLDSLIFKTVPAPVTTPATGK